MWCFSLDVCKKRPKTGLPTDFDFVKPFIGPRKLIKNPRLRCWGNISRKHRLFGRIMWNYAELCGVVQFVTELWFCLLIVVCVLLYGLLLCCEHLRMFAFSFGVCWMLMFVKDKLLNRIINIM